MSTELEMKTKEKDAFVEVPHEVIKNEIVPRFQKPSHLGAFRGINSFFYNISKDAMTQLIDNDPLLKRIYELSFDMSKIMMNLSPKNFLEGLVNTIQNTLPKIDNHGLGLQENKLRLLKQLYKVRDVITNKKEFEDQINNIVKTHFHEKTATYIMESLLENKTLETLESIYKNLPDAEGQKGVFGPIAEYGIELMQSEAMGVVM